MKKTTVLCIMDGYGLTDNGKNSAISKANKPNIDKIFKEYNMVKGYASGLSVGLPDGQMGNSEVGHLNIGAGRIVYQDFTKINKAIEDGSFFDNKELIKLSEHCKKNNSTFHIMGLLSDGGVHSHISHIVATLEFAKRQKLEKILIHCFMDGRDTNPMQGKEFIDKLSEEIKRIGVGTIASICGRYYAMDRDKNYDRVEKAYNLLVKADGKVFDSAKEAIEASYKENLTDEFVKPCVIKNEIDTYIKDNDGIFFVNFRPDRARQMTRAFVDDDFTYFKREKLNNIMFVNMTECDITIKNKTVAFPKAEIINHLGEYLSNLGLTQLRTAETEKYAHVTFFFNGGKEEAYKGEDRILVPSPKEVPTYDLKPEMSANAVCDNVLKGLDSQKYDLIVVNFANPDMVGHTGVMDAAIKAIETVDTCVGKIFDKVIEKNDNMMIIADHGNAEVMIDENGKPWTAHTTNPVPFCVITPDKKRIKEGGQLCDVAPTLLSLMDLEIPNEMTGESLII